ncbi:TPA: ATP-binding protein [Candidatus Bipolaricaulota bacterium]|nr:ATP-binding protein [Candidatus Bipolaricaulota bacterium]
MFAKAISGALLGLEATLVEVQCDVARGLPSFVIVGLPEKEVQESRERIRSAITNSSYEFPSKRITINLAPADVPKEGVGLDLPLALALLRATGQLELGSEHSGLEDHLFLGELSLDGELRPVKGVLSIALAAKEAGIKRLVLPKANALEAALIPGLEVLPLESLQEALAFLQGELEIRPFEFDRESYFKREGPPGPDMNEIHGQEQAKRALEIAAAGGHNVLMVGPPGAGKSMLARRLPTILPPLSLEEALETTKIYSVLGLLSPDRPLITQRPFRSPHHTISYAGMVGGGHGFPKPGEISLAHHGVLFLDELPEFSRDVLEALRQPLEDRRITISRAVAAVTFPANFTLVAAMNPCACTRRDAQGNCICTPQEVRSYWRKISGPFLDRIDIFIEVPRLTKEELMSKPTGEPSAAIRVRVERARRVQYERFTKAGMAIFTNAQMGVKEIERFCRLSPAGEALLARAVERFALSARAYHRILKVSRTIADLEGAEAIREEHLAEAIQYRSSEESFLEGGMWS